MSTEYAEILSCADRISRLLGPHSETSPSLITSRRLPEMPDVILRDLIPPYVYERLEESKRVKLSFVLQTRLSVLKDRFIQQYWQLAERHFSLSHCGVGDIEVEAGLLQIYEVRYSRCLDDVRTILEKVLARNPYIKDNRGSNTRGGFGDVSPPHITQANKFSKPSEPSKQHPTTPNPPSQQK